MTDAHPTSDQEVWEQDDGHVEMPSGLLLPEYLAEEIARKSQRPKAVDLFCGCGGFSLGFIEAGYEVVAGVDNDTAAAITYTVNLGTYPLQFHFGCDEDRKRLEKALSKEFRRHDHDQLELPCTSGSGWIAEENPRPPGVGHFFLGDIRELKGRDILDAVELEIGELDVVIGSPPCQGFSHAGKRRDNDPRNELIFEYARLVCEMKPKAMCMENVPGIVSMTTHDGLPILDAFIRVIEDGGFAGLDALRMSLKAQTGISFMRNKRAKKNAVDGMGKSREKVKVETEEPVEDEEDEAGELVEETVDV